MARIGDGGCKVLRSLPKVDGAHFRLLESFKGDNRIVIADSWFGSVETALALYEHGFYAILNVKTAHRGYPKNE
eukprot:7376430-Prymnesium_polylepis.2